MSDTATNEKLCTLDEVDGAICGTFRRPSGPPVLVAFANMADAVEFVELWERRYVQKQYRSVAAW